MQLPPIGGGAPPVAAATTSTSDARHVRDVQPVDLLRCQHSARIASHQGVLENTRGRGERRQRQERENTRERSRRNERPARPDIREVREPRGLLEGELKKPKLEHESDLSKHAHLRDEDELMDAKGPPVFDLTQRDDDDDDGSGALCADGDAVWKTSNLHADKRLDSALTNGLPGGGDIIAPTPHLGPAPSTPITLIGQHQSVAPPWISDLLESMATLHQKQDRTHVDVLDFGNEIKNQALRLDTPEVGMRDHTHLHEVTKARIDELEKQVLILQQRQTSRSPTPTRGPPSPRRQSTSHPRSPRSPHFAREEQPETDDLQVVVGGWTDARKSEAFEEVKHMLSNIGHPNCWSDLWAPASRTNFVRITLSFPDESAHISQLRMYQNSIIAALKSKSFRSGIEGQSSCKLWAKNKNPEERARVRACVLTKVFFENLPEFQGQKVADPEIVWQGRVFLNHIQVLHHIDKKDPVAGDCFLPDNKGNHVEWFISALAFHEATNRPSESLQECYAQYGSNSAKS